MIRKALRIFLLQFCYALEIGAYLAYTGHYDVTLDNEVKRIAKEELRHMVYLKWMLINEGTKPDPLLNVMFLLIGYTIKYLCHVFPVSMLDSVACSMEKLNV